MVTPERIFDTFNAYLHTASLKGAIELDLFTAIGEGNDAVHAIAKRIGASERGTRILCDFLTIHQFLQKDGGHYKLTAESATFLDRRSPAYIGAIGAFLSEIRNQRFFDDVAAIVRKGGTVTGQGSIEDEHPIWVEFARSMAPMMEMPSRQMAEILSVPAGQSLKVLDIAAGHGLFGIAIAQKNPQAEVFALDWAPVLAVATENASKRGVASRHHVIEGSAFDASFGKDYDLVLLTNFLHHFDPPTCETLLRKVHAALKPGGRVGTLEFVPNDDRITPPSAAGFSMMMLGTTPSGDAYTFTEFEKMFENSGFSGSDIHNVPPGSLIVSRA